MKFGCSAVAPRIWRARVYVRVFNLLPISSSDGSFLNSHSPAYRNSCPRSRPPSIARVDQHARGIRSHRRGEFWIRVSFVANFFRKTSVPDEKLGKIFLFFREGKQEMFGISVVVIGGRADRRGWDKWINLITRQGE